MMFFNTVLYNRLDKVVHEPTEENTWHADHITMYCNLRPVCVSKATVHRYMICTPHISLNWFMRNVI